MGIKNKKRKFSLDLEKKIGYNTKDVGDEKVPSEATIKRRKRNNKLKPSQQNIKEIAGTTNSSSEVGVVKNVNPKIFKPKQGSSPFMKPNNLKTEQRNEKIVISSPKKGKPKNLKTKQINEKNVISSPIKVKVKRLQTKQICKSGKSLSERRKNLKAKNSKTKQITKAGKNELGSSEPLTAESSIILHHLKVFEKQMRKSGMQR